jgi:hypothetical protein
MKHTPGCRNMACTYSTCKAAHASLIAAAPDLLEALRVVRQCIADAEGGVTLGSYEMGVVRAALAKAAV